MTNNGIFVFAGIVLLVSITSSAGLTTTIIPDQQQQQQEQGNTMSNHVQGETITQDPGESQQHQHYFITVMRR